MERQGIVTFKGNGITLLGTVVREGDQAPNFTATDQALKPVQFSEFAGSAVVISSVPSLDTPVCELQTKRFNEEAPKLKAKVITISMDLPFAQKRFCGANQIEGIQVLSDYKDREFGKSYGVYIKELGLLARAVFLIGKDGKVAYMEIVKEISQQPDYARLLEEVKKLGL
jgi:thioredoxin-dependent peroxiredoxin